MFKKVFSWKTWQTMFSGLVFWKKKKFISGSGIYTPPSGAAYVKVTCWGGGGGHVSAKGGEGGVGPGAQGGRGGVAFSTDKGTVLIEHGNAGQLEEIIASAAMDRGLSVEEFKSMHLQLIKETTNVSKY